jgi:hypothetical protein
MTVEFLMFRTSLCNGNPHPEQRSPTHQIYPTPQQNPSEGWNRLNSRRRHLLRLDSGELGMLAIDCLVHIVLPTPHALVMSIMFAQLALIRAIDKGNTYNVTEFSLLFPQPRVFIGLSQSLRIRTQALRKKYLIEKSW